MNNLINSWPNAGGEKPREAEVPHGQIDGLVHSAKGGSTCHKGHRVRRTLGVSVVEVLRELEVELGLSHSVYHPFVFRII
jgi:hypothetical protein